MDCSTPCVVCDATCTLSEEGHSNAAVQTVPHLCAAHSKWTLANLWSWEDHGRPKLKPDDGEGLK